MYVEIGYYVRFMTIKSINMEFEIFSDFSTLIFQKKIE